MGRPRKKDREKQQERPAKKEFFDISQETRNSIWGIISFIAAVMSVLAFVHKAGSAGEVFNSTVRSLFGWGFFIVPIAFALLGIAFIKSISRKIALSAIFGTLLFVLSSLAIFYILGDGQTADRIVQGGYLGSALGYPLLRLVGFLASLIVLIALIVISILLTLNAPLYQLVKREDQPVEKPMDKLVIKKGGETVTDERKLPAVMPGPKPVPTKAEAPSDREFVIKNLKLGKWVLPPLDLLNEDRDQASSGDIQSNALIIKRTLSNFGIDVEMGEVSIGPTVTQYTLRPAVGVKLARISALNPDLSLALAAHPIRIEAPIPGKSLVGIEVPNKKSALIGLRDMFSQEEFTKSKYFLPLAIGRDVAGAPIFAGLDKMPHLLIAGATGTGKSVTINAMLLSMLYKHSPEMLKLILVDPKRVELSLYNEIPHLITPVITDTKKVLGALRWAVGEMDRRYEQLSKTGSRDIFSYNAKMASKTDQPMPFIIIVIDELADLMVSYGRDVEAAIVRLAQMSRAVGIHLIVSTQRPSVEVITGLIKANITSRMALQVASQVDSRTILDMAGAEKLLGRGDMLYMSGDASKPRRVQGLFVTEHEVKDVVAFLRNQAAKLMEASPSGMQVDFNAQSSPAGMFSNDGGQAEDDMYEDAKQCVIESGKASASLLQRRLRVGYARAARLLDILEEKGIIGPGEGAKPREVFVGRDGAVTEATLTPDRSGGQIPSGDTAVYGDTPESEEEV